MQTPVVNTRVAASILEIEHNYTPQHGKNFRIFESSSLGVPAVGSRDFLSDIVSWLVWCSQDQAWTCFTMLSCTCWGVTSCCFTTTIRKSISGCVCYSDPRGPILLHLVKASWVHIPSILSPHCQLSTAMTFHVFNSSSSVATRKVSRVTCFFSYFRCYWLNLQKSML